MTNVDSGESEWSPSFDEEWGLTAATGNNDTTTNSAWGSGLLSTIESLGTTAGNIIGSLRGNRNTGNRTQSTGWQKYLPWAIGGLVVVGLVVLFTRR